MGFSGIWHVFLIYGLDFITPDLHPEGCCGSCNFELEKCKLSNIFVYYLLLNEQYCTSYEN